MRSIEWRGAKLPCVMRGERATFGPLTMSAEGPVWVMAWSQHKPGCWAAGCCRRRLEWGTQGSPISDLWLAEASDHQSPHSALESVHAQIELLMAELHRGFGFESGLPCWGVRGRYDDE